jgi:hypothetical protein
MIIDYSPRASGKTTKLIEWIQEDPNTRYLITFSSREEYRLKQLYPELDRNIYYWETWVKKKREGGLSGNHSSVAVDNADYILERVLETYINKVSITKEEIDLR